MIRQDLQDNPDKSCKSCKLPLELSTLSELFSASRTGRNPSAGRTEST